MEEKQVSVGRWSELPFLSQQVRGNQVLPEHTTYIYDIHELLKA